MTHLKLPHKHTSAVQTPEHDMASFFVDPQGHLSVKDPQGKVTAIGYNQKVTGQEIHIWIKDTFIVTSAQIIVDVLEQSKVDIDKTNQLRMIKPASFAHTSGTDVIDKVNEALSETALPFRVTDIATINSITETDDVWECKELLAIALRHVGIVDL